VKAPSPAHPPAPRATPQNGEQPRQARARPLVVQSYGLTHPGRERATNQDHFVCATLTRALWIKQSSLPQADVHYADDQGHLFIVADGMGGAQGGEKASALAVGVLEEFLLNALRWLLTLDGSDEANVLASFKAALRRADACVYEAAANDPRLKGMGTTLTMAYSLGSELFVAHAGDSRCYLFRAGVLHQLTRDDTLVQELVETGLMPPEEAAKHPFRHAVTNVVGGNTKGVRVEVHNVGIEAGDVVLLCSDGVTGMLSNEAIAHVLRNSTGPQAACEDVVRLANERGGKDNITAVVAHYAHR
jgi:PPM family protein phosphatase